MPGGTAFATDTAGVRTYRMHVDGTWSGAASSGAVVVDQAPSGDPA